LSLQSLKYSQKIPHWWDVLEMAHVWTVPTLTPKHLGRPIWSAFQFTFGFLWCLGVNLRQPLALVHQENILW
jgi:hypothetical protein